ncbi:MAG: hypothetical protein R3Y64_10035 [Peptostreptococcaceae bacterium]
MFIKRAFASQGDPSKKGSRSKGKQSAKGTVATAPQGATVEPTRGNAVTGQNKGVFPGQVRFPGM